MKPFLRRIHYDRVDNGPLIIRCNDSVIGACLNQFPAPVQEAVAGYHFNTPFELEALLVAAQHGPDLHSFVVDDLKCRHAMEFMEVFMPDDVMTIRARNTFPQLEPHILTSPMAQALVDMMMDGDLGIGQQPDPDDGMEI